MVADLTVLVSPKKQNVLVVYRQTLKPLDIAFELGKAVKSIERSVHKVLVNRIVWYPLPSSTTDKTYQNKCTSQWSKTHSEKDFLASTWTRYNSTTVNDIANFLKDVVQGKIEPQSNEKLVKKITKMPDPELKHKGKFWELK